MNDDEFKITPETFEELSVPEIIKKIVTDLSASNPWSEDFRVVSTAIGGKSYLDHMQSTLSEFHTLQFKEMDKGNVDEIEIILLKMEGDIRRLNSILKDYLRDIDKRFFGKGEGSE